MSGDISKPTSVTRKSYFAFTQEEEDEDNDDDVYRDFQTKFSFSSTWKCVSCGSTNVTSITTNDHFAKFQIDCRPGTDKAVDAVRIQATARSPLPRRPLPPSISGTATISPSTSGMGPLAPLNTMQPSPPPQSGDKLRSSPVLGMCSHSPLNSSSNGVGTRIPGTKLTFQSKNSSNESIFENQSTSSSKMNSSGIGLKSGLKTQLIEQQNDAATHQTTQVQNNFEISSPNNEMTATQPKPNTCDSANKSQQIDKTSGKGDQASKNANSTTKSRPFKEIAAKPRWYQSLRNPFKMAPKNTRKPVPESWREGKKDLKWQLVELNHNEQLASEAIKSNKNLPQRKDEDEKLKRLHAFVSEKGVSSLVKAELVMQIMEMGYDEATAILAARDCDTIDEASAYLHSECPTCHGQFPAFQMIAMYCCTHACCIECTRNYFLGILKEQNILNAVCPVCRKPDLQDEVDMDYFNHLGNQLKNIFSRADYEFFQMKLRDQAVQINPSFKWCEKCDYGYYFEMSGRQLRCPKCNYAVCLQCRKEWKPQHEGNSCEMYALWLSKCNPESRAAALDAYLNKFGMQCPSCKSYFENAKGGCMHFKCTSCKFEFCSGCCKPFMKGRECHFSENCKKSGLHVHHSRACHYYLQDKDPSDLQKLLLASNVEFLFDSPLVSGCKAAKSGKCHVGEQKTAGQKVEPCGKSVKDKQAGVCRKHYIEYLVNVINKNALDPAIVFDIDELRTELARNKKQIPPPNKGELKENYRRRLVEIVKKEIPLANIT